MAEISFHTTYSDNRNLFARAVNGCQSGLQRHWCHRFGFNGQEMDNEITGQTGTHTTAMFWEYDSRLGRRWNLDPVKLASISPYACLYNNPVYFIDGPGNSPEPPIRTKAMNFFIVPSFKLIWSDMINYGFASAYLWDFFYSIAQKLKYGDRITIIQSNNVASMVEKIKKKCGKEGYIDNMIIDFHSERIGKTIINSDLTIAKTYGELNSLNEYFGPKSIVLLGACWGGIGYTSESNPEDPANPIYKVDISNSPAGLLSSCWENVTVLGNQAYSSSIALLLFNTFVGIVLEGWASDANNLGVYTVAFNGKAESVKTIPIIQNAASIELKSLEKTSKQFRKMIDKTENRAIKKAIKSSEKQEKNTAKGAKKRDNNVPKF